MAENYIKLFNLSISEVLYKFVNDEALPGLDIKSQNFWRGLDRVAHELTPINRDILKKRHKLQLEIDRWHLNNKKKLKFQNIKNF